MYTAAERTVRLSRDPLTDSLVLATLAFTLVTGIESVSVATATAVTEGSAGPSLVVVEPSSGIVRAFSHLGLQSAHVLKQAS